MEPGRALPRHVVLVVHAAAMGGMETMCVDLAAALCASSVAVTGIAAADERLAPLRGRFENAGATYREMETGWNTGNLARVFGTARFALFLLTRRPDVVHLHTGSILGGGSVALACLLTHTPLVTTEHGVDIRPQTRRTRILRQLPERTARIFVSVSGYNAARSLTARLYPGKQAIVLNGIALDSEAQRAQWRSETRASLGISDGDVVIGIAARFDPVKRVEALVQAAAPLLQAGSTRLLLVGDGSERASIEAAISGLGVESRVVMTGAVAAARPLVAAMDVFVLPQLEGSMSISVLEAMHLGCATVIGYGGEEEPVVDGVTGIRLTNGEAGTLTNVLARLVTDVPFRERLASAGKTHVDTNFSAARMASQYLQLYRAAARRRPVPASLRPSTNTWHNRPVSGGGVVEGGIKPGRLRQTRRWFISGVKWRLHINRPKPQLVMWYRESRPPLLRPIPAEFTIRTFQPGDEEAMCALLDRNGELGPWDRARLDRENATLVGSATYFACDGDRLVATAGVHDREFEGKPAWEIGWVATDPDYLGLGLGRYVTAAATRAALELPHREIFLKTDDHRLPAIAIYRDLGYQRDARTRSARKRWRAVGKAIADWNAARPVTPGQ